MLDNIKLGQYLHGSSWYYRLDPRGKLVLSTFFIIVIFLANNFMTFLGVALFTLAIVLTSGISVKFFYRSIKPIFLLVLLTFILNLFLVKSGGAFPAVHLQIHAVLLGLYGLIILLFFVLRLFKKVEAGVLGKVFKASTLLFIIMDFLIIFFRLDTHYILHWNLVFYKDAIVNGSFVVVRLVLIVCFSSLLTFTTKPTDLTLAIEHVLGPFKVFKLPVSELALMISISLRFIPTLLEETQKILKAQTSRGADFTEGNLKEKVVQIISLLIPMFIISFKRAEDLANAMEARGYEPGKLRTSLKELHWSFMDTAYLSSFVLLFAYLVAFRYFIIINIF